MPQQLENRPSLSATDSSNHGVLGATLRLSGTPESSASGEEYPDDYAFVAQLKESERVEESIVSVLKTRTLEEGHRQESETKAERLGFTAARQLDLVSSWEGRVLTVNDGFFTARVSQIDHGDAEYEVDFAIEDVDSSDRSRLEPGALFYWNIGYDRRQRPRRRVSEIWLRRIDLSRMPTHPKDVEAFMGLFAEE